MLPLGLSLSADLEANTHSRRKVRLACRPQKLLYMRDKCKGILQEPTSTAAVGNLLLNSAPQSYHDFLQLVNTFLKQFERFLRVPSVALDLPFEVQIIVSRGEPDGLIDLRSGWEAKFVEGIF